MSHYTTHVYGPYHYTLSGSQIVSFFFSSICFPSTNLLYQDDRGVAYTRAHFASVQHQKNANHFNSSAASDCFLAVFFFVHEPLCFTSGRNSDRFGVLLFHTFFFYLIFGWEEFLHCLVRFIRQQGTGSLRGHLVPHTGGEMGSFAGT